MSVIEEVKNDEETELDHEVDPDVEFQNYRLIALTAGDEYPNDRIEYEHINDDEFNTTQERNSHLNKVFKTVTKRIEKETKVIEENILMEMYLDSSRPVKQTSYSRRMRQDDTHRELDPEDMEFNVRSKSNDRPDLKSTK